MSIKQAEKSSHGMAFFSLLSKRMVGLQIEPQYLGASGFQECRRKCRIFWQDSISILTLPLVSTTSKHQTPQELGSGHPCPSASMCVCVQAAFTARTKRKEHSSSEPPYLTLTGFLWAAVAEAEPVQRKGWKGIRRSLTTSSVFHSVTAPVDYPESSDAT